jgi:TatD DNase family protein
MVTFKNAGDLRAVAERVPLDRLVIETDSPYLAPAPVRGRRNEPAFVAHTAAFLADHRGIPVADFCRQTVRNSFDLFSGVGQLD